MGFYPLLLILAVIFISFVIITSLPKPSNTLKNLEKKFDNFTKKKDPPEFIPTSKSEVNRSKSKNNDNIPKGISSFEKLKKPKGKGLISDKNAKEIQKKILDEVKQEKIIITREQKLISDLENLKKLFDEGLIDEDIYQEKQKDILDNS